MKILSCIYLFTSWRHLPHNVTSLRSLQPEGQPTEPAPWRQGCQARNSASRFSLPRCRMMKVLHRPLQKSSHEGDQRHLPPGASQPRAIRPSSLAPHPVFSPANPHSHPPRPKSQRQVGFSSNSQGEPPAVTRLQLKAGSSPYPSSKQPQCRLQLHSRTNWRQWPMLGRGFMENTENNQLEVMDGGGREERVLYF